MKIKKTTIKQGKSNTNKEKTKLWYDKLNKLGQ